MGLFKIILIILFAKSAFAADPTIAQIGNERVKLSEFKKDYSRAKRLMASMPVPPTANEFMEDWIRFKVGLQEAKKNGVSQDTEVKKMLEQTLYKAYLEKKIGPSVEKIGVPSPNEMRAYYSKYPNIRTSHILVRIPFGAKASQVNEAKSRATKIYRDVKASKRKFADLVKLYSEDELNKNSGGDVGYHSMHSINPKYYQAALKTPQNGVAGIIQTQFGFHILKVTGRMSYDSAPKEPIRMAIFDAKRKRIFDGFFKQIKPKYKIQVNQKLLSQVR